MTYYQAPRNAGAATQLPRDYRVSDAQQFEEMGAAFHRKLLDDLRNAMGFQGYINTDSRAMLDEGQPHGIENLAPYQREAKAIAAGSQLISLGSGALVNGQTTALRSLLKTTYPNATLVEDYNDATHALPMLVPNNFTATDTSGKKYEKISPRYPQ